MVKFEAFSVGKAFPLARGKWKDLIRQAEIVQRRTLLGSASWTGGVRADSGDTSRCCNFLMAQSLSLTIYSYSFTRESCVGDNGHDHFVIANCTTL